MKSHSIVSLDCTNKNQTNIVFQFKSQENAVRSMEFLMSPPEDQPIRIAQWDDGSNDYDGFEVGRDNQYLSHIVVPTTYFFRDTKSAYPLNYFVCYSHVDKNGTLLFTNTKSQDIQHWNDPLTCKTNSNHHIYIIGLVALASMFILSLLFLAIIVIIKRIKKLHRDRILLHTDEDEYTPINQREIHTEFQITPPRRTKDSYYAKLKKRTASEEDQLQDVTV